MIQKRFGIENSGYRLIALLITLILWVTVVSQKETRADNQLKVQYVAPPGMLIKGDSLFEVTVRLEGPRFQLKRFLDRKWVSTLVVPLRQTVSGMVIQEVPVSELGIPSEIKVLSINPREVVLLLDKR
jgi:YbbR domain-containing protein